MKKRFILIGGLTLFSAAAFAQVGINTDTPKATLDVAGSPGTTNRVDGVLTPRLTGIQLRAKNSVYGTDQNSALVYVTAADTAPAGKTINVTTAGYYYYDAPNSVWVRLNTNSNTTYRGPWNVKGTTDAATLNNQDIYQRGNIGIRTSDPIRALHIVGDGAGNDDILIESRSTTPISSSQIQFSRSRGEKVAAQKDDRIGDLTFGAFGGSAADGVARHTSSIGAIVSETPNKDSVQTDLIFRTGVTSELERLRILSTGNIGINTSTPGNKLEIKQGTNGNSGLRFSNLTSAGVLGTNASGDVIKTSLPANGSILSSDANGNIVAATAASINSLISGSISNIYNANGTLSGNRTVTMGTNTLAFPTTATTGTSHFTVDGTTFNVDAANDRVGIGFSSPSHKLTVNGDGLFNNSLHLLGGNTNGNNTGERYLLNIRTGADYVSYGNIVDDRGIRFYKEGMHEGTVAAITAGVATNANSVNDRFLSFKVRNDTETDNSALTIRSFGPGARDYNVGIGNFDPKNKLEVTHGTDGNSGLRLTNLKNASLLGTNGSGDVISATAATINTLISSSVSNIYNSNGNLGGNRTVTMGTNTLSFPSSATSGTSHFTIDGNTFNVDANTNRVGIGVTAPSHNLHAQKIRVTNITNGSGDVDSGDLGLYNQSGTMRFAQVPGQDIRFYTDGATGNGFSGATNTPSLVIRDGNVGIGTNASTNLGNKLVVVGATGESGIRTVGLKGAQILGTDAAGDVIKTAIEEGGSNWTSPVVIDNQGKLKYHKVYDWSAPATIPGVAGSSFILHGYNLPDNWGAVYDVSISRVNGCGATAYAKAKLIGSTHASSWKIYPVEGYFGAGGNATLAGSTLDYTNQGITYKAVRWVVTGAGTCQDGDGPDDFNMGIAINPATGNLGFINYSGKVASKTYNVRITQIL